MNILENVIQGILVVAVEVICCNIFFETFLEKRTFKKKYIRLLFILTLIVTIYIGTVFLADYFVIKELFVLLAISIIMYTCFETKFIMGIALTLIFQGLLLGVDYFSIIIIRYIMPGILDTISGPVESILLILICKMLLFGIIILIKKRWNVNDSLNMISDFEWLKFLYFPVMTIVAIISMLINFDSMNSAKTNSTLLIIAFGLVIMNIFVFYLIRDIVEREIRIQEDKLFRERVSSETNMYRSISENFEKQRKRAHEYKNHMGCIEGMLNEGNITETLEYVSKITGGLQKELDSIDTNNVIINAILNTKYQEANEKNIVMAFRVNDLSRVILKDEDIVIILSNLLSNAIEACEEIEGKRVIQLKFVDEDHMTVISVKNTANQVKIENNQIITSKKNKEEHGIGIRNIQDTVEKYDGSCVIQNNDGTFYFSIIIPHIR